MKKVVYFVMTILWMSTMTLTIIPCSSFAQYWKDPLWLVGKIGVIGTDKWPSSTLLDTIRSTIKWILGILATIALCICLYAWFKMLTSWGDSKSYEAGWGILKNASIGLAIIWLSWLIVSAIFWFVELQWWGWTMTWN